MRCSYPESNKRYEVDTTILQFGIDCCGIRGFPPGYIAALEKRLLETELALFDTLNPLPFLQSSPTNDRVNDLDSGQERHHNLDTRRVLAKQSINQTKAEKVAEWERLPIGTSTQQMAWVKDRMSLVGMPAQHLTEQYRSGRQPQVPRSLSSSDLQTHPQTFLQPGFMQNQDKASYLSPGGTSDGSVTRDENPMMPPPFRPAPAIAIATNPFGSPLDSTSSAAFAAYQAPALPPEHWRTPPSRAGPANLSSWLRLTDQDQSPVNPMSTEGNMNEALFGDQTPGGSRAQQLSSSQWRRFF